MEEVGVDAIKSKVTNPLEGMRVAPYYGCQLLRKESIMSTIMSFIKKHPVLTYFVLTFALSWSGVLLAIGGPGKILVTPEETEKLFQLPRL